MSETIRCARCDMRLAMEDAEAVFVPDPDEPWAGPRPEGSVYLLVCAECADRPKPPAAPADAPPTERCERTGNECGTDTWPEGWCCSCTPCVIYVYRRRALSGARPGEWERCNAPVPTRGTPCCLVKGHDGGHAAALHE